MTPADRTTYVSPDALAGWCARFAASHAAGGELKLSWWSAGADLVVRAADGATARLVDRWTPQPDVSPVSEREAGRATDAACAGFEQALDGWLAPARVPRTVAVLLVRRGAHAVGIAREGELLAHHTDTHHVQGRTKAGGWSQQRYARRRANQAEQAWERAADDVVRVVLPQLATLDALVVGGDRPGVDAVLADRRLARLATLRHPHVLAVAEPRHAVLQSVARDLARVPVEVTDPPHRQS